MAIRKFKPVTPASRYRSVSEFDEITRSTPEKALTEGLSKTAGRNHHGRITSRRRGGGHKRLYRKIDFKRNEERNPGSRWRRSSTIRTVRRVLPLFTTWTAKSATSPIRVGWLVGDMIEVS